MHRALVSAEPPGGLRPEDVGLFTDLYQLTMARAYFREGIAEDAAVFDLNVRALPPGWNALVACGIEEALAALAALHVPPAAIEHLRSLGLFDDEFLAWLGNQRFAGSVRAVPEGTPVFPHEPILQVEAPLAQAQLAETIVLNQVHLGTLLASKGARVVAAAEGRSVVDFGLRRTHGYEAGMLAARAFDLVGVAGTSNVLAGQTYGIPVVGTMAHSYVQAHATELGAFRAFVKVYPETILLVDTYDTVEGVRNVIRLARELGPGFRARGIRLDSGDLGALAKRARAMLDEAGLTHMTIFASGNLDEHALQRLIRDGAPIDGFGVGTRMGVSADQPYLDMVYKLVEVRGEAVLKTSPGKVVLPGRKQVFRGQDGDVLALADEAGIDGRPLLRPVLREGRIVAAEFTARDVRRAYAREQWASLPAATRGLSPSSPYAVNLSPKLAALRDRLVRAHRPAKA